jgi:hypothetical protein
MPWRSLTTGTEAEVAIEMGDCIVGVVAALDLVEKENTLLQLAIEPAVDGVCVWAPLTSSVVVVNKVLVDWVTIPGSSPSTGRLAA